MAAKQGMLSNKVDSSLHTLGYQVMQGRCDFPHPLWHWHRGVEIVIVNQGAAEVFSKTWRTSLGAGEATIAPADVEHGAKGSFTRTVVHFVPDMVSSDQRERVQSRLEDVGTGAGLRVSLHSTEMMRISWAANQLHQLQGDAHQYAVAQALLGLILIEIEASLEQPSQRSEHTLLQPILNYMRAHPESEETLDVLAGRFDLSKGHMCHLFQRHLGCPPRQFWLGVKMERACELLRRECSIGDIATTLGFQSSRGFSRAFQRAYGVLPSHYRVDASKERF